MRSFSAWLRPATYWLEPTSPTSSAAHHARRIVFCGSSFDSVWPSSSSAAEPDPLSLMPGPAGTESRCAPAITTLSSLTPGSSAITFFCGWFSMNIDTVAVEPGCASADPAANDVLTTGMSSAVGFAPISVTFVRTPIRSGALP